MASASSSSSIHENFKYHVFLSFRGEDTRTTFVDYLYNSLINKCIRTFIDNEELEKGKRIDKLLTAIEESKFFIIILSKNYASSSWCLKELAKIMDCQDGKERIAYLLFHDVDPSDMRKLSGPVKEAFDNAMKEDKTDEQRLKKALDDAGNLVGYVIANIANRHEAEAINLIVKEISAKIRSIRLSKDDENLVGMESRMQDVESSLRMDLEDEVRMIGIKGMGGIGKTTLARAIYQKLSSQFEGKSFVDNVREASKGIGGLLSLQKQVIKDVFGDDNVSSFQDAISMMKDRMSVRTVLLILDDVDDINQLEALAGAWFKGGSRIIITTRNEQLLKAHGVKTNWIHDVTLLLNEEAKSLFSRYAFKRYIPDEGFEDLSLEVVKYAAGLPLTLKVLGSSLFGKEEPVWKDTLKRLETIPWKETQEILEISYYGLEDDHKEIFLDVACFMKRMWKKDAIRKLESRGFHAITGLTVLEDRSLITIDRNGCLDMHDSIQELGRNIVRREHPGEPNKHSRLWIEDEIKELLSDNEVTEGTAICISMKWLDLDSEIIMKGLRKLKNLRFLQIHGNKWAPDNCMFDQDYLPNSLQFLNWWEYPCRSLPQTFRAKNLVGLELPNSKITKLWESGEREVLKKLRFLNLSESKLRSLDLGMTPNLERLDLHGCPDLTDIHAPAGCLKRLVFLDLHDCSSFRSCSFIQQLESAVLLSLPILLVNLKVRLPVHYNEEKRYFECRYVEEQASSLENNQKSVSLDLQPGTKIESVSGSFFHLQHLRHLKVEGCIPEVPNDLDQLTYLEELNLVRTHIKSLPDNICSMRHLKSLKLEYCKLLEELPKDVGRLDSLEKLSLLSARITHVPDSICMLKNLKSLKLVSCYHLEELPRDLGQLDCLEELDLGVCKSLQDLPNSICNMKHLKVLDISWTGISQLPQSISSLEGLLVFGDVEVLQSCDFATSEYYETFCYIKAVNTTPAPTELKSHSTEKYLKRNFAEHQSTNTKQVQEMQSSGVNNYMAANVSLPQQTTGALQSTQSKYLKVWEGNLFGLQQGQPVLITRLVGYQSSSASESLAANWPPTMQIVRLISEDKMNNKQYVGKADLLVFRAMSQHGFLGQLQEKKLCAVIQLPSQTLLLFVSDKEYRLIGMLFPGDMVVFKPQISDQQPQQHHLQLEQQILP